MNALKTFNNYMVTIGARKPQNAYSDYEYELDTIYGVLRASIHESDYTKSGKPSSKHHNFVSIYASFKDFEKSKPYLMEFKGQRFPTNAKINYHLSGGDSVEENWMENFGRFKMDLEKILSNK